MTGYSTGTAHIRELGEAAERLVPGIPALDPAAGRNWRCAPLDRAGARPARGGVRKVRETALFGMG